MKVFLDECVDWRFGRLLAGHDVKSARDMGWTTIKNGELLALVAAQFDIFITVDRNLAFQQNVATYPVAVVVLRAKSNRLAELAPLAPDLISQLSAAAPGAVTIIARSNPRP